MEMFHPVECWKDYSDQPYIWILLGPMILALVVSQPTSLHPKSCATQILFDHTKKKETTLFQGLQLQISSPGTGLLSVERAPKLNISFTLHPPRNVMFLWLKEMGVVRRLEFSRISSSIRSLLCDVCLIFFPLTLPQLLPTFINQPSVSD